MRQKRPGKFNLAMAVVSLLSLSAFVQPASAKARHSVSHGHRSSSLHKITFSSASYHAAGRYAAGRWHPASGRRFVARRNYGGGHVIQCVAYAKSASEVMLHGNARDWWHNAAGVYDRGNAPETGSVLNFRSIRRMPLGHVAVVRSVINSRTIIIDQSHWAQAGISHNVPVIDVSPNNDWSAVRVALNNRAGTYGSIYPTYGFIYPRTPGEHGNRRNDVMMAWAKKARAQGGETQLAQAPENAHPITSGAQDNAITFDGQQ
ncbi:CHAP domain-containing protein [Acetobacter orleanensis]|uniref:CHAP domain-containing protein n=1 Tax=Acetobacter orleanensis TaxID=104099 RepID=A0A4Y3TPM4_9PROT|nr:CHAP domain-containing protein [Acetobacter orleanensis]KXV62766.1 hypothetical protein AD949_09965 [Acetobacter orleanensis]PCD78313.1 CHAP domain-containing protein [Acetobacter orleanensis]GAN67903.1 hypothetical protein Abol_012_052 [Acetobacter orleanensis JCM 7639]GEB83419.1 CHAP domain-containing protein [Acetobacter orleanensis]